jgi:hypothetical protein
MKKKIALSLLALTIGFLPALANETVPEPSRIFLNAGNIENISILSDMEVVLLQAPTGDHSIILDKLATEKLNLRLSNKTLYISGKRGDQKQKTIVYLYVSNLKSLTVDGDSQVKTMGSLETGKLDVFVDGNAKVHIRTSGTVKAHSLNDSEVAVKYITGKPGTNRGF